MAPPSSLRSQSGRCSCMSSALILICGVYGHSGSPSSDAHDTGAHSILARHRPAPTASGGRPTFLSTDGAGGTPPRSASTAVPGHAPTAAAAAAGNATSPKGSHAAKAVNHGWFPNLLPKDDTPTPKEPEVIGDGTTTSVCGLSPTAGLVYFIPSGLRSLCMWDHGLFVVVCAVFVVLGLSISLFEYTRQQYDDVQIGTAMEAMRTLSSLLRGWFTNPDSKAKAWLTVFLVTLLFVVREASWAFILSDVNAEVLNSLSTLHEMKSLDRVKKALWSRVFFHFCFDVPLFTIVDPLVSKFAVATLRTYITELALKSYFIGGGQAYYKIKMDEASNGIDNPDQRIVSDSEAIASLVYGIYSNVLSSTLGCSMWMSVIYHFGGRKLVALCVLFTALRGLCAIIGFGKNLVKVGRLVQMREAQMRYGLVRVRDSAEEIALDRGDARECRRGRQNYENMMNTWWSANFLNLRYNTALNLVGFFPGIFLWLMLIPYVINGSMELGDCNRVHYAYDQIEKVVAFFVDNFATIAALQSNGERLVELLQACNACNLPGKSTSWADVSGSNFPYGPDDSTDKHGGRCKGDILIKVKEKKRQVITVQTCTAGQALLLRNLTVQIPNVEAFGSTKLIGGLSLQCTRGQGLLIMAPSGTGKTSVLRAVGGLWREGEGEIHVPFGNPEVGVSFMPMKSYLPIGTLADLVFYPSRMSVTDKDLEEAKHALERARLTHLIDEWGWEKARDWRNILSSGEHQRIGFARLLAKRPQTKHWANSLLAILDEATGAVDLHTERQLYDELRAELAEGGSLRGFVSVGHRTSLLRYHNTVLVIGEETLPAAELAQAQEVSSGTWQLPDGGSTPWRHYELKGCFTTPAPDESDAV